MKILFRVDAYPEIGLGHFVRSIAIALKIRDQTNIQIVFAGRYNNHAKNELKQNKIKIFRSVKTENEEDFLLRCLQSEKPDLIFIDNLFNYTDSFLQKIKNKVKSILFHNLCDGRFQTDAFILPSAHHPQEIINDKRWQKYEVDFRHGYDYIPINDEIKKLPLQKISKEDNFKISITTGGSDPKGVMLKVVDWLRRPEYDEIKITVLPGQNFIFKKELKHLSNTLPENFIFKNFNYSDLESSDLVICTFGVTSYELIFLGIPFISIAHAQNNARGSQILSKKLPFMKDLGLIDDLREEKFHMQLEDFFSKENLKIDFRKSCRTIMDGNGINRIIDIILNQLNKK